MGAITGFAFGTGAYILLLLAVVLAVAWTLLPFALFGTKRILRSLLAEQERTNELLEELAARDRPPMPILEPDRPLSVPDERIEPTFADTVFGRRR